MNNSALGDVSYNIDHEKRFLYVKRRDELSKTAIYAEWEAMQQVEGFDPSYDTVVDYSNATILNISFDDLREISKEVPIRDPRTGNIAIVSGDKPARYTFGKLFVELTNFLGNKNHGIFKDCVSAEQWLLSLR